jgi:UDP-N-acetylglucosamine--N-acetylmuramyl-(pentapeptide) pyrophosphoryl-undecaprenol N-acetylglucosamine transferase
MHVVVAGGGTAGHIEPALSTADALRRRDDSMGITALGTEKGLEVRLVPERGYELALIPPVPLPRKPSGDLFSLPGRVRGAVVDTQDILAGRGADVVVGFGGYVALPAYLAARRLGLPFVIHEANARPGLANKLAARMTPHVAVATDDIPLPHAVRTGIPLRRTISTLDRAALRAQARETFGLDPDLPTLLVFGGSQGAASINRAVEGAAAALAGAGVQVIHAYGRKQTVSVSLPDDAPPYVAVPYLDRMDLAYSAADLVLSRSGAMTCAEIAALGLPAIYVPYPVGNGEQRLNALPVVRAGGGLLVDDEALSSDYVATMVPNLINDEQRLAAMSTAAADFGILDGDDRLVDMVLAAARAAQGVQQT